MKTWQVKTWQVKTWQVKTWQVKTWQVKTWQVKTWQLRTWQVKTRQAEVAAIASRHAALPWAETSTGIQWNKRKRLIWGRGEANLLGEVEGHRRHFLIQDKGEGGDLWGKRSVWKRGGGGEEEEGGWLKLLKETREKWSKIK